MPKYYEVDGDNSASVTSRKLNVKLLQLTAQSQFFSQDQGLDGLKKLKSYIKGLLFFQSSLTVAGLNWNYFSLKCHSFPKNILPTILPGTQLAERW